MENNLYKIVQGLGIDFNSECDTREYHHPGYIKFGNSNIVSTNFDGDGDLVSQCASILGLISKGVSIEVEGNIPKDVAIFLDHACGYMVQHFAKNSPLDNFEESAPVGLLSIVDEDIYDEAVFMLRDIVSELTSELVGLHDLGHIRDSIENDLRMTILSSNLRVYSDKYETYLNPFINYDFHFGGKVGRYRLLRSFENMLNVNKDESSIVASKWRVTKAEVAQILNRSANSLRAVENIMGSSGFDKAMEMIEQARRLYL